ncbi:unnamed protein product, partial [Mesorhabditis spiculigera]
MPPFLLLYSTAEILLAVHITLANFVVLWVYVRNRSVRTVTNSYIVSLAFTDFLSGLIGIPVTVWSVHTRSPNTYIPCLLVHLLLCVLCTISTLHMLAIAIDKHATICRRDRLFNTRKARACILITSAWFLGTAVAIIPIFEVFGLSREPEFEGECHFTVVMDYRYLVYIIFFGTILVPSAIIAFCYIRIYSTIREEEKQVTFMLNRLEKERRMANRRKLIRTLLILVFTYGVCWYPLYLINTWDFLFPTMASGPLPTLSTVVLSHVSCALNPLIYAYGMPGFKKALRAFFNPRNGKVPYPLSTQRSLTGVKEVPPYSRVGDLDAMRKRSAPAPTKRLHQPHPIGRRRTLEVYT